MNMTTVELKFTCGCGFVTSAATLGWDKAIEAAKLHAEEFGHKLHAEGTVSPSDKRMQVKRMHRVRKTPRVALSMKD